MKKSTINISNILDKTIVVGLSYYDNQNNPLKIKKLTGKVIEAHELDGITLLLSKDKREFTIPSDLSAWLNPLDENSCDELNAKIERADYLVAWDIHQKKRVVADNQYQWWDWIPRTPSSLVSE